MSSVPYPGNGTSTDDSSHTLVTLTSSSSSSTSILPHPYLNSPSNVNYPPVPSSTYPQYYPHPLPQQPLLHMSQSSGFYPATNLSHLAPPADFSNSSSSVASSSSSLDSARKATNRKRTMEKTLLATKTTGKRKASNQDDDDVDDEDDDDEENKCYLRPTPMTGNPPAGEEDKEKQARENHCEIERRRRVKMATYFAELCDMVPSCANLARKPDKLTILRMAAQFMKNLRTTNNSLIISPTGQADLHKPSFLNDQELKYLMVESCDAFLFALNCENLRVIYVSDAIQYVLSYNCQDWYSRFFYDLIHPDDVEKVREQFNLQSADGSPTGNGGVGRILDLKTGTVKKDGHASGARLGSSKRSFICRLRVGPINPSHPTNYLNPSLLRRRHRTALGPSIDGQLYEVVHINGYIRNLSNPHPLDMHPPSSSSSNNHGQMAFVAIARVQTSAASNVNDLTNGSLSTINSFSTEFTCRCHWETSEILFVDQRCTPIIGYKSQDLLHKILFDQIHPDDQLKFQDLYKRTVTQKNSANPSTNLAHIIIRFRTNLENDYVSLKCSTYAFCNPCTDEIEFLIVTFLSLQPVTSNKTSVIANANDYTRHAYDSFTRTTYSNADGQDYSNGNGGRTYNVASSWSTTNENWNGTGGSVAPATGGSTSSVDYSDAQNNLNIYHSYHS